MLPLRSLTSLARIVAATMFCSVATAEQPARDAGSLFFEFDESRQLLVVLTADWAAVSGEIRCFEREDRLSGWSEALPRLAAVVGRNGVAWGSGLHGTSSGDGPMKREGDGKAPAGVFRLVEAFGLASPEEAKLTRFPYRQLTDGIECIDDPDSRQYNRLVDVASVNAKDWRNSERMRRIGDVYRWGVVVAHNWQQVPGAGSCIFLHVWEDAGVGTSGCTAMPEEHVVRVIRWLDRTKVPILVQLPRAEYERLRAAWKLP